MNEEQILITEQPYKQIQGMAEALGLDATSLDFTLLGFSSSYTLDSKEWITLAEEELSLFDDDKLFLDKNLIIKQKYKVKYHQIEQKQRELENKIKLISNKNISQITASINANTISYHENLAQDLKQAIYKKMLKAHLLIAIRIFELENHINDFVKALKEKKALKENFQFIVAKGVAEIPTQNESLILTYKEKIQNNKEVKKVSVIGVDEGELVLKHYKAKLGKVGRGLNFNFIPIQALTEQKLNFSCSDKFEKKESEYCVEYIAKQKGFVSQHNNKFDIENSIDYGSVDFKNTGAIYAGLDNNVSIKIKNKSELNDAVGTGVYIECEELNIEGNVAQNTILKAKKLHLVGFTHTQSKIYAQNAYINKHRGYIEGENIQIDLLENGTVKGKNIKIKKSLGGIIQGENIFVESLMNGNNIIFGQIFALEKCEGGGNKIVAQIQDEKYSPANLEKMKQRLQILPLNIKSLKNIINKSKEAIEMLKQNLISLKKNKQNIPQSYIDKIKEFDKLSTQLSNAIQEEQELKENYEKHIELLKEFQIKLLDAKIINKSSSWTDMNEIRYKFFYPKEEYSHSTSAANKAKGFYLKKTVEENKEIMKIAELDEYDEKDLQWLQLLKV